MVTLLSQAKETRLPHGLSGMVAQVFIVVVLDDGQQKPHNMSWILTKKGGGGAAQGWDLWLSSSPYWYHNKEEALG